jgi:hypothetical protein
MISLKNGAGTFVIEISVDVSFFTHIYFGEFYLIPLNRSVLEKLIVTQLVMEPMSSLFCPQEPTTGPCPEPYKSVDT